jgi:DNA anti-recombination protein RmuC
VGLILDLAVAILALLVLCSLALLAWTLAVSSVQAVEQTRARVQARRQAVADQERRLGSATAKLRAELAGLAERTRRNERGDRSNA